MEPSKPDIRWAPKATPPSETKTDEVERINPAHPERPKFGFSPMPNVVIKEMPK